MIQYYIPCLRYIRQLYSYWRDNSSAGPVLKTFAGNMTFVPRMGITVAAV